MFIPQFYPNFWRKKTTRNTDLGLCEVANQHRSIHGGGKSRNGKKQLVIQFFRAKSLVMLFQPEAGQKLCCESQKTTNISQDSGTSCEFSHSWGQFLLMNRLFWEILRLFDTIVWSIPNRPPYFPLVDFSCDSKNLVQTPILLILTVPFPSKCPFVHFERLFPWPFRCRLMSSASMSRASKDLNSNPFSAMESFSRNQWKGKKKNNDNNNNNNNK